MTKRLDFFFLPSELTPHTPSAAPGGKKNGIKAAKKAAVLGSARSRKNQGAGGTGKVGENCGLMEMFLGPRVSLGSVWLRRGNEMHSDVDGAPPLPPPPQPFSNLGPIFQNSQTAPRMHRRLFSPLPLAPCMSSARLLWIR